MAITVEVVDSDHLKLHISSSDAIICFPGKIIDERDKISLKLADLSEESTNFFQTEKPTCKPPTKPGPEFLFFGGKNLSPPPRYS
jgi:hypothetical protein